MQSGGASRQPPPTIPNMGYPGSSSSGEFSVYVGDLDPNVTDSILLDAFSSHYKTVLSANVIVDPLTKRSKKYGFVKFGSSEESQRAIYEMNGKYILSRPIKLNVGFKKSSLGQQNQAPSYGSSYPSYGQGAPAAYPHSAYPGYSQDPYGGRGSSYSYGGYGYGAPPSDPYAQPSQYSYGAGGYSYPPTSASGSSYGMSIGGQEYSMGSSSYYNQPQSYPSYDNKSYLDNFSQQSYPAQQSYTSQPPAASTQPDASGYQYNYGGYAYDYGTQGVPATTPEPPAPVQEVKEIDIDLHESEITPLYTQDAIQTLNREYFEHLISTQGKIDIM